MAERNVKTGAFLHHAVVDVEAAVKIAMEINSRGQDCYFACAEYETDSSRTATNATGAWGFWADIDCGEKKAAEGKGYADVEQGRAALDAFCRDAELPQPNILINSGSGIHAYWALADFVTKDEWQTFARKLKAVMGKLGFLADPSRTADIASVLRIPGTLNHKYQPALPVTYLHCSEQHIANAEMFAAIDAAHARLCGVVAATPSQAQKAHSAETAPQQAPFNAPLDLDQIGSALAMLDPDCDEYTWKFHRICPLSREAKLHPEHAEKLKQLARDWSSGVLRGSPAKSWSTPGATNGLTGEQAFEQVWSRFMSTEHQGRQATVGTLFMHAREQGWQYSSRGGKEQFKPLSSASSTPTTPAVTPAAAATQGKSAAVQTNGEAPDGEPAGDVQPESEGELIARLASMTPMEYGRVRNEVAKVQGVPVKALDDAVKAQRKQYAAAGNLPFSEHEPTFDPVNPDLLFNSIHAAIRKFIVLEPEQADAATLWVLQTHLAEVAEVSPILLINAPERACAKTLLQQLLGRLAYRPLFASNASTSALFRSIEKWCPTLMIDEADTFFRDNSELHGMVNAGYKKGGFVLRAESVGDSYEPKMFPVYGPKCIAGISLQKHIPDATMSRGIPINMRRKMVHEKVERMRNLDAAQFEEMGSQIARFAIDYASQIRAARPHLPEALSDRAQDNWEPLLAIASCAGDGWLKRATDAALKLSTVAEEKVSTSNDLLTDIRTVLTQWNEPRIKSVALLEMLCQDKEMDWGTYSRGGSLTARQLAKLLEPYGIKPKTVRQRDGKTPKGYEVSDFVDAFGRYLKPVVADVGTATPSPDVAATAQQRRSTHRLPGPLTTPNLGRGGVAATPAEHPRIPDEPAF